MFSFYKPTVTFQVLVSSLLFLCVQSAFATEQSQSYYLVLCNQHKCQKSTLISEQVVASTTNRTVQDLSSSTTSALWSPISALGAQQDGTIFRIETSKSCIAALTAAVQSNIEIDWFKVDHSQVSAELFSDDASHSKVACEFYVQQFAQDRSSFGFGLEVLQLRMASWMGM